MGDRSLLGSRTVTSQICRCFFQIEDNNKFQGSITQLVPWYWVCKGHCLQVYFETWTCCSSSFHFPQKRQNSWRPETSVESLPLWRSCKWRHSCLWRHNSLFFPFPFRRHCLSSWILLSFLRPRARPCATCMILQNWLHLRILISFLVLSNKSLSSFFQSILFLTTIFIFVFEANFEKRAAWNFLFLFCSSLMKQVCVNRNKWQEKVKLSRAYWCVLICAYFLSSCCLDRRLLHDQPVSGRHSDAVLGDEETGDGADVTGAETLPLQQYPRQ